MGDLSGLVITFFLFFFLLFQLLVVFGLGLENLIFDRLADDFNAVAVGVIIATAAATVLLAALKGASPHLLALLAFDLFGQVRGIRSIISVVIIIVVSVL
jgi:hypothetical protein